MHPWDLWSPPYFLYPARNYSQSNQLRLGLGKEGRRQLQEPNLRGRGLLSRLIGDRKANCGRERWGEGAGRGRGVEGGGAEQGGAQGPAEGRAGAAARRARGRQQPVPPGPPGKEGATDTVRKHCPWWLPAPFGQWTLAILCKASKGVGVGAPGGKLTRTSHQLPYGVGELVQTQIPKQKEKGGFPESAMSKNVGYSIIGASQCSRPIS